MALLVATPNRNGPALAEALRAHLPEADIRVWPDVGDPESVEFVLAWNAPTELFGRLPNLRAVSSLGAGVDRLLAAGVIAENVDIGRLVGPRLAADMAGYLVAVTAGHWKGLRCILRNRRDRRWAPPSTGAPPVVGILGTGAMGRAAGRAFAALDFDVSGWNRSGRRAGDLVVHSGGNGLVRIAQQADVVINLLPLTEATRDILDARLFAHMRHDSLLINVGRGEHLVEADLLEALDRGRPGCAVLDVFREEPLPADHPFWAHPRIVVTPHCAAVTRIDEAAELAADSYRRVMAGGPPLGAVDRGRGY